MIKYLLQFFFSRIVFLSLVVLFISTEANAQDLESMWKKFKETKDAKAVKFSGGINGGMILYDMRGIPSRRSPFAYSLNANLGIKLFGLIDVSSAINYNSNSQLEYTHTNPKDYINGILSKTGISPKYKALTIHLGDRNMSFSKYTYAGVSFYGIGAEINPKNSIIAVSAFRGRLQKSLLPDSIRSIAPAYERMGWGSKLDIGKKGHKLSLILFHAEDDLNSQINLSPIYLVKPQENFITGFETKNKITKNIDFKLEYVMSAFTADLRAPEREIGIADYSYYNNIGSLYSPLQTSRYNKAINTGLKYKGETFNLGGEYKRVDPTFVSLGSLSAKNDFEAYTLNGGLTLFQNKISITTTGGTERNNLSENLTLTMRRFISSLDLAYNVSQSLMFSGSYANFNHTTGPSILNLVDTIKIVQVNENGNLMATYNFGSADIKHTLSANTTLQKTQDIQEYSGIKNPIVNNVANYSLSYNMNNTPMKATATVSGMFTEVKAPGATQQSWGPALALAKKMFDKKITLNISAAYLNSKGSAGESAAITNYKLGGKYAVNKHHTLKIDLTLVHKNDKVSVSKSFTESQGRINYAFTF